MSGTTWSGRQGAVILGPTQHRVALYLDELTRRGWIRIRTDELAARLNLERSEAYRILARLRVLGLFGVASDRGGHAGGRRVWRTAIAHDGRRLDPVRHRVAWSRIRGAARRARAQVRARLDHIRDVDDARSIDAPRRRPASPPLAGASFASRMRAAGLGRLMDDWGIT